MDVYIQDYVVSISDFQCIIWKPEKKWYLLLVHYTVHTIHTFTIGTNLSHILVYKDVG